MILSQVQTGIPSNAASPMLPCVVPHLPTPSRTSAVAVVIFVPPEAPTTIFTLFISSTKMEGHIEDIGCLPVGDTEAQLSTCSSQTSNSRSMSKPRAPVSTSLTQLMCPVQFLGISPSPALMSLALSCPCPLQVPDLCPMVQMLQCEHAQHSQKTESRRLFTATWSYEICWRRRDPKSIDYVR